MTTLTERLLELDKEKEVNTLQRTSVVYPVRSGTKNLPVKFQIGGKALYPKKVARNPIPIFNGTEFLKNVNKKVQNITSNFVKVQVRSKIVNLDTKDDHDFKPTRYIGMEHFGGVGTAWQAGKEQKLQEMKLTAMTFMSGD